LRHIYVIIHKSEEYPRMKTNKTLQDEIQDYFKSLDELNLISLKLMNDDEIVGVLDGETPTNIRLFYPLRLLPTYLSIERWRPIEQDLDEDHQDDFEFEDDFSSFDDSDRQMQELFMSSDESSSPYGVDDLHFQNQQKEILFNGANSKKIISFFHMIEWFQHTNQSVLEINKAAIITSAEASTDLKHEYMVFLRGKMMAEQNEHVQKNTTNDSKQASPVILKTEEPTSNVLSNQSKSIH